MSMFAIADLKKKPLFWKRPDVQHLCRRRTLCLVRVVLVLSAFCITRPVQAQERGAIGGELSAGIGTVLRASDEGYLPTRTLRGGVSAWYRLVPAFAMGVTLGGMQAGQLDGSNVSQDTFIQSGKVVEAFADGRLFPSSFVGAFGRVSVGVAFLDLVPPFMPGPSHLEEARQPILELEAGPELRISLSPRTARPRPDFFLRVRGTLTAMSAATFAGYGIALGFEG
ncbi:MAG: hypothetical protein ABIQ16_10380 [Polyangiaceae bacterium]